MFKEGKTSKLFPCILKCSLYYSQNQFLPPSNSQSSLALPVGSCIKSEEILHCEDHHTRRVQAEKRDFVLVTARQHLQFLLLLYFFYCS